MKLDKGDYVILLQVRHERRDALERLKDSPLLMQQKLTSNVSVDAYASHANALSTGKKFTSVNLAPGRAHPVFFAPISDDKYSDSCLKYTP